MTESSAHGRLERIRRIRRRVVGASLVTFALAWATIAGTGSQGATTKAVTSRASAVTATSSTYDDGYAAPSTTQAPLTTRAS